MTNFHKFNINMQKFPALLFVFQFCHWPNNVLIYIKNLTFLPVQDRKIYCTTQGIQSIFYNNDKWIVNHYCTPVTYNIVHNYTSIRSFPSGSAVKNLPGTQETQEKAVQSLGREDSLQKDLATHSSILAWRIPRMEEPGGLQSTGSQRVGHDWATSVHFLHFRHWQPTHCSGQPFRWMLPRSPHYKRYRCSVSRNTPQHKETYYRT